MSLLSMCQQVARTIKIDVPSSIIGNTGDEATLLLGCAQDEGESLSRKPSAGWTIMQQEYDFTTASIGPTSGTVANTGAGGVAQITGLSSTTGIVANQWGASGTGLKYNSIVASVDSGSQVTLNQPASATGAATDLIFGQFAFVMPSDFERPIDSTMWDRDRYWQMRGPLSPQQWQFYKSSIFSRATIQRRFRFRRVNTSPPSVLFLIDPVPTDNGTQLVLEYASNAWCRSSPNPPGSPVLQTSWQADSDVGILDEYLIRLGIKWRALERLGMAYDAALSEYETEVDKAIAQDGGSPILDMAPRSVPFLLSPWGIQDGNWPGRP